jgi:hypothetical protein
MDKYDSAEFTLATGQTNYDVKANQAASFANIKVYKRLEIRTNVTLSVKFNSTSNAAVTISATDSPYTMEWLEVTNIYITNSSGSTASIKILGVE